MKGIFIAKHLITYIVSDAISRCDDPPILRGTNLNSKKKKKKRGINASAKQIDWKVKEEAECLPSENFS